MRDWCDIHFMATHQNEALVWQLQTQYVSNLTLFISYIECLNISYLTFWFVDFINFTAKIRFLLMEKWKIFCLNDMKVWKIYKIQCIYTDQYWDHQFRLVSYNQLYNAIGFETPNWIIQRIHANYPHNDTNTQTGKTTCCFHIWNFMHTAPI